MGYISNDDTYINPGISIPIEPVILPCENCRGEDYPNYRHESGGDEQVLCLRCLERETARKARLSEEEERLNNRGYV